MKKTIRQSWLLLLLLLSLGGFAQQTKESLQKEVDALQKEITLANKLLKETSDDKKVTVKQVTLIDKKIQNRENIIEKYNQQIKLLDKEIKQGENKIDKMNGDLETLREEYTKLMQFAYRNRNHYDRLEYLFAAKDFNQAMRRMRYFQQISDACKKKMDQIDNTQKKVSAEVESNKKAKQEQAALLAEEKAQQAELKKEKEELNSKIAQLQKKEGRIQQDIKEKQAQAKKFQKQIDEIIEKEIRLANERAKGSGTKTDMMVLTPEEQALASSFTANKGKLPWPVERGIVSSTFGKHASAVSNKVTLTNNGIDIMTTENAAARCVFDGEVVSVVKPAASNMGVIIRHGDYFSVYSQLDEVYVNRGDRVKTKQNIGKVHTDRAEGNTEMHFELRHGTKTLDPSVWLAK